jgi:hypothetical protein
VAPTLLALVLVSGSIVITVARMEPLNRIANTWRPGALPSDRRRPPRRHRSGRRRPRARPGPVLDAHPRSVVVLAMGQDDH